ncbi:MAG: Slp family lipoprotein [Wenzhouxiangellaceae bacterium]
MRTHWMIAIVASAGLSACASIPEPLQGEFPATAPQVSSSPQVGSRQRWGGVIIATNPEQQQTCFEILGKPLEDSQRPIAGDEALGRFIACKSGFQDPEVFKAGRDITVIGRVDRLEPRNIGEYEYRYPILDAEVVYLWPERPDYAYRPTYYPYFWGGFHPFYNYPYGFGRLGFYGRYYPYWP